MLSWVGGEERCADMSNKGPTHECCRSPDFGCLAFQNVGFFGVCFLVDDDGRRCRPFSSPALVTVRSEDRELHIGLDLIYYNPAGWGGRGVGALGCHDVPASADQGTGGAGALEFPCSYLQTYSEVSQPDPCMRFSQSRDGQGDLSSWAGCQTACLLLR